MFRNSKMWKSLVLKKSPCFNCLLIWRELHLQFFWGVHWFFYSLSPKIFSEFSTRKAGEAKVKKLEQQLKKLLGFDPSPFGEVNVCLVFFVFRFHPAGVWMFFFRCFLWSIFFCWEILFWERNADGFRNLETSVRSYWGYVVASFASSFEQPIVRKWMHHDTKFHKKNPRTARNNSVKNFTLLRNLPLLPGLIMSPIVCPHRLPHLPFFTNLTRIFRPKIFEPAGSLGKFAYESGKNAVNIFGTSWFWNRGAQILRHDSSKKWGTKKDITKGMRGGPKALRLWYVLGGRSK